MINFYNITGVFLFFCFGSVW